MVSPTWQLSNSLARYHDGKLTGLVDASHFGAGVHRIQIDGTKLDGQLLAVQIPSDSSLTSDEPCETYVRDEDLIATFQTLEEAKFRRQIYWRRIDPEGSACQTAIELLVSVQTELLDSQPSLFASSCLVAEEVFTCADLESRSFESQVLEDPLSLCGECLPKVILWRPPGGEWSYAEMPALGDSDGVILRREADGRVSSEWRLFAHHLEKGVILRSRLRGVILPRAGDMAAALQWYDLLLQRSLPLAV